MLLSTGGAALPPALQPQPLLIVWAPQRYPLALPRNL